MMNSQILVNISYAKRSWWIFTSLVMAFLIGILIALSMNQVALLLLLVPFFAIAISRSRSHYLLVFVTAIWSFFWLPGIPLTLWSTLKDALLIGAIVIILGLQLLSENKGLVKFFDTVTSRILCLFLISSVLGVISSPDVLRSAEIWARFLFAFLQYYAFLLLFRRMPWLLIKFAKLLIFSVLISSIYILLAQNNLIPVFQPPVEFLYKDPITLGFNSRSNAMAWAISFVAPLVTAFALTYKSRSRRKYYFWLSSLVILGVVCVSTSGRGGLIATIFSSLIVFTASMPRGRLSRIAYPLMLLIIVGAFIVTNPVFNKLTRNVPVIEYLVRGQPLSESQWNVLSSDRTEYIRISLEHIKKNPLIGVGYGNYTYVLRQAGLGGTSAHNLYLGIAVEAGIFVAVIVLIFMGYIVIHFGKLSQDWVARHNSILLPALYGVIFSYFVQSLFDVSSFFYSFHLGLPFWIALAGLDALTPSQMSQT